MDGHLGRDAQENAALNGALMAAEAAARQALDLTEQALIMAGRHGDDPIAVRLNATAGALTAAALNLKVSGQATDPVRLAARRALPWIDHDAAVTRTA